ncbi:MAG: PhzF family phenazine biosynthesis protein [Rickettsiales bacterium]|jgi:PhzF family phenazine biosynthesis protein|nr:PhzF family phenazine biosynthesis protein [Rickettsiales bacterium]
MLNYKYTAFSYDENIDGRPVLGNPSSIFLLDPLEKVSRETMSKLGLEENYPMTCFLRRQNTPTADYDVFFYNLDGSQAYMCGSATMASAFLLHELFKINTVNFHFDTAPFAAEIENNVIRAEVEENGRVFLEQSVQNFSPLEADNNPDINFIAKCLQLENSSLEKVFRADELNDLVFVVKDSMLMRNIRPDFRALVDILNRLGIRNLCTTARGRDERFDIETRVFVPHDNLDEDLACGSSILAIGGYWKEKINKNSATVLFPYHMEYEENRAVGGIQFLEFTGSSIRVGGHCKPAEKR